MPTVILRTQPNRVTTSVTPPVNRTFTINRTTLTNHLDDLIDVDTTDIPQPFPPDMIFNQDERYTLVYNPTLGKWIAAPEPVITEVDGGTY